MGTSKACARACQVVTVPAARPCSRSISVRRARPLRPASSSKVHPRSFLNRASVTRRASRSGSGGKIVTPPSDGADTCPVSADFCTISAGERTGHPLLRECRNLHYGAGGSRARPGRPPHDAGADQTGGTTSGCGLPAHTPRCSASGQCTCARRRADQPWPAPAARTAPSCKPSPHAQPPSLIWPAMPAPTRCPGICAPASAGRWAATGTPATAAARGPFCSP